MWPGIKLNDRSMGERSLKSISGTHPQDSQRQTGYRNRFMNACATWTTRSYAQFQGDFRGDALDEVGDFFIGGNVLVRGLVG